jgi:hypothetical protein
MVTRLSQRPNTIYLNGQEYPIEGNVQVQDVNPFIVGVAATGTQEAQNFSGANHWFIEDLTGGFGIDIGDIRNNLDRFWDSTISTHVKKRLTLPPLINTALTLATGATVQKFWDFGGKSYAAATLTGGTYPIYCGTAGAWSGTAVKADLGAPVVDFVEYRGNGIVLFGENTTFQYSSDMASWTANGSAEKGNYGCIFDDKFTIIKRVATGSTYGGQIRYGTDVTGALTAGGILENAHPTSIITHRDAQGNPCVYIGSQEGLAAYDFWSQKAYPQDLKFDTCLDVKNCIGMSKWHNNALWIPAQASLWQYTPGNPASVVPIGPDLDAGLPAAFQGNIIKVIPTIYCVYILIQDKNSKGIILRTTGGGRFHYVAASSGACYDMHYSNVTSPPRLYFGDANAIKYVTVPDIAANEYYYDVATQSYAPTGYLTTWRFHGGLPSVPKVALRLTVRADNVAATETVVVQYKINGTGDWSTGVTIDSMSDNPISFGSGAGLEFYDIQFKFTLTTTTTLTPRIWNIDFEWLATPTRRYAYTQTLLLMNGELPNYTGQQLITAFNTALGTNTLLAYYPDGDTSGTAKYVRIEQAPYQTWAGRITKEGRYRVRVVEF